MLGITVPIERMVRGAAVRWCELVLRREERNILKEAVNFEVNWKEKKEKTKSYLQKNKLKL